LARREIKRGAGVGPILRIETRMGRVTLPAWH
jgi:hypothetical protein